MHERCTHVYAKYSGGVRISPVQVPVPAVQLFLRIRNALSAAAASENLENLPKLDKDRLQALR